MKARYNAAERIRLELTVPIAEEQPGTWASLLRGLLRLGEKRLAATVGNCTNCGDDGEQQHGH